ncbi:Crp/Fnr family transcriptional regulator [Nonomuraea jiangxiensis]|uniref:CRP/FNR family transcriptional regulator, anaerobic regulatory protein n=1 Tax=Nonomuraea jiangxiensis TaxID=633440 RepID=A0A1G8H4Q1_9ACTN|nr:Crp/Fnr family transcriptional regulator [Nonomuraea jiangxiensis]SDI01596.1 CRP/FNR family transcriptional regulator, anaerobic regulatory protein [Nonomuraea jiangxiensis]
MTYTLADLPMFADLDMAVLRGLTARRRSYPAGQVLCTEGDPADQLIVLLDGRVKAARVSAEGREVVLAVEAAPVAFDKTALLVDGPHRATRTAMTPVEVAYLPRPAVLELVATEPSVAARLLRTLAATVRDLDERLIDAAVRDVPSRVATWLVRRCATGGPVPLYGGQAGLGAEIGATRVSVNRALRGFERRGMIEIRAGEVTVLDRRALARLAAVAVG